MRKSLLVIAVLAAAPISADAADIANGARLAQRWCASCHLISRDQRQASTDAAPFHELARRPGFDEAKLAFFLLEPHPKMPGMSLSRAEATDLAAYIGTQK